jgi:hypothetical protein
MIMLLRAARIQIASALARGLRLLSLINQAIIESRQQRAILEAELFHGRYRLPPKNDDDLLIVR